MPGRSRRLTAATLREHCLAKPGAWLDEPWEGDQVVKVGPKIFAFLSALDHGAGASRPSESAVGLKCGRTREDADEWVRAFPADARPSPYIGRFGWNVLTLGGAIPDEELLEAADASYDAVLAGLPRAQRPGGDAVSGQARPGSPG